MAHSTLKFLRFLTVSSSSGSRLPSPATINRAFNPLGSYIPFHDSESQPDLVTALRGQADNFRRIRKKTFLMASQCSTIFSVGLLSTCGFQPPNPVRNGVRNTQPEVTDHPMVISYEANVNASLVTHIQKATPESIAKWSFDCSYGVEDLKANGAYDKLCT